MLPRYPFTVTRLVPAFIFLAGLILVRPVLGADTCIEGYVWREAFPHDHVCVTPAIRAQAASDNGQAASRREPGGGAYGPDTCRQGYVWREASPDDHVCVIPETRTQAASDYAQKEFRRAPETNASGDSGRTTPTGTKASGSQFASFWTTLPGIITAIGGLVAALAALITAVRARH